MEMALYGNWTIIVTWRIATIRKPLQATVTHLGEREV